jgi:hypothetical protein
VLRNIIQSLKIDRICASLCTAMVTCWYWYNPDNCHPPHIIQRFFQRQKSLFYFKIFRKPLDSAARDGLISPPATLLVPTVRMLLTKVTQARRRLRWSSGEHAGLWVPSSRVQTRRLPTSWDQPTSTTAHNNHQPCVCVVPPEDGQVMPETCRESEPQ